LGGNVSSRKEGYRKANKTIKKREKENEKK